MVGHVRYTLDYMSHCYKITKYATQRLTRLWRLFSDIFWEGKTEEIFNQTFVQYVCVLLQINHLYLFKSTFSSHCINEKHKNGTKVSHKTDFYPMIFTIILNQVESFKEILWLS